MAQQLPEALSSRLANAAKRYGAVFWGELTLKKKTIQMVLRLAWQHFTCRVVMPTLSRSGQQQVN